MNELSQAAKQSSSQSSQANDKRDPDRFSKFKNYFKKELPVHWLIGDQRLTGKSTIFDFDFCHNPP